MKQLEECFALHDPVGRFDGRDCESVSEGTAGSRLGLGEKVVLLLGGQEERSECVGVAARSVSDPILTYVPDTHIKTVNPAVGNGQNTQHKYLTTVSLIRHRGPY